MYLTLVHEKLKNDGTKLITIRVTNAHIIQNIEVQNITQKTSSPLAFSGRENTLVTWELPKYNQSDKFMIVAEDSYLTANLAYP